MGRKWLIATGSKWGEFHFIDVTDKPAEFVLNVSRKKDKPSAERHRKAVETVEVEELK